MARKVRVGDVWRWPYGDAIILVVSIRGNGKKRTFDTLNLKTGQFDIDEHWSLEVDSRWQRLSCCK